MRAIAAGRIRHLARHRLLSALVALVLCSQALALAEGDVAPPTVLPQLASPASFDLSSLRGNVVLVDFWASWCAPCRESLPLYETLYGELAGKGFELVAINLDEHLADAIGFLERYPVSYTVLSDPQGRSAEKWSVPAMPTSYLLDSEGRIIRAWAGFNSKHYEELRREIQKNLP